jgi:uncharacterized repeat protein (TIGR03843 family)
MDPAVPASRPIGVAQALALLQGATLTISQRLPWSSNGTWLACVEAADLSAYAVYKPRRAERPLWDFPAGTLCLRETAAFVVSQALGWQLVPPTVLRDGPLGPGSLQLFIPHDPEVHYLALEDPDPAAIRRLVALDAIINNADRKSGHVILAEDGRLWAIDHGISFHVEPKLRTVIWDYAGQPLPAEISADLDALAGGLTAPAGALRRDLAALLCRDEIDALIARTRRLVQSAVFPGSNPRRRAVPWPLV